MSLLSEGQAPRKRRKKRRIERKPIQPKWSALNEPLAPTHPDQILTLFEWCQLNRISVTTGRRILASNTGPTVTQLTPKRVGVSVANNAVWQRSRERRA
jgi:hypothetical protein